MQIQGFFWLTSRVIFHGISMIMNAQQIFLLTSILPSSNTTFSGGSSNLPKCSQKQNREQKHSCSPANDFTVDTYFTEKKTFGPFQHHPDVRRTTWYCFSAEHAECRSGSQVGRWEDTDKMKLNFGRKSKEKAYL